MVYNKKNLPLPTLLPRRTLRSRKAHRNFANIIIIFLLSALISQYVFDIWINVVRVTQSRTIQKTVKDNVECDRIHVGFVCAGYKNSVNYYVLLKSIFFYRTKGMHFHIIADTKCKNVFETLFSSWNLPQVEISFYNNYITEYSSITLEAYKLLFFELVSTSVAKLIVLSADLIFISNINELWTIIDEFEDRQVIGLLHQANQTNLYKLYSSDILLLHLKNWYNFEKHNSSTVGRSNNQSDIFNRLSYLEDILNKSVHYYLSCKWNPPRTNETPNKYSKILYAKGKKYQWGDFTNSFLNYNGNLLRYQNLNCTQNVRNIFSNEQVSDCFERYNFNAFPWRTLLHFINFNSTSTNMFDVTLVSQLTFDRWKFFEEVAKRWEGPISITFYGTDHEFEQILTKIVRRRNNIAYHVVFKEGNHHPYNKLRNVALRNVATPYVFLVDIDFLPMQNLYVLLKNYIAKFSKSTKNNALIVPAVLGYKKNFPSNKTELLKMLDRKILFTKHPGLHATNYKQWTTATQPYKVKWQPKFEPYIVVRRNVTEYDERFVGYGGDKISHIMELEAQGYQFIVLPDVYILHKTHRVTEAYWEFRRSDNYIRCLNNLKQRVQDELTIKYGRTLTF